MGDSWRDLYSRAVDALGSAAEARWVVEEVAGGAWPGVLSDPVGEEAARSFAGLIDRRRVGEPLQYVLGHWAFRALDLTVDARVLIPRPETEHLVDVALAELDRLGSPRPVVVDLGTGSGAIALSMATERADTQVWGVDESAEALEVAGINRRSLERSAASRVHLTRGCWWSALPPALRGRVTLAISNPPYISSGEMPGLDKVVSGWEPHRALEAGPTGLEDVAAILGAAASWLARPAAIVIEIAPHQADEAAALGQQAGFVYVDVRSDLTGRPRALVARTSPT